MIRWQWCDLSELSTRQLYALFAAREAVFVVEQTCPYQELDGLDLEARHLIGWSDDAVAAYLRVLAPGVKFAETALGRVLTTTDFRGTGIGRELMQRALDYTDMQYAAHGVRISAQAHLQRFYGSFGFTAVSQQYLEDGITHIEMLRAVRTGR
ncbi:GNAT family N-acetyltransferase [Povalibacter sp.]|uniref:GNAT family N-acetyltransferase n=1 Tax=Povalibacter sp. TaxID=1962978 RepID=UPI002F42CE1F